MEKLTNLIIMLAILWPVAMIAAFAIIGAVILIKKEDGTISPVKLYHIYRRQLCEKLKEEAA